MKIYTKEGLEIPLHYVSEFVGSDVEKAIKLALEKQDKRDKIIDALIECGTFLPSERRLFNKDYNEYEYELDELINIFKGLNK